MIVERHSMRVMHTGDKSHRHLVVLSGMGEHHSEVALSIVNTPAFAIVDASNMLIEVPDSYWRDVSPLLDKLDGTQRIELQVHYDMAQRSVSYFSLSWPAPEILPPDVRAKLRGRSDSRA